MSGQPLRESTLWRQGRFMSLRDALEQYTPRRDVVDASTWARVRPVALDVAMTWDGAVSTALNRMPALAQFLAWADEAGLPLTAEVLWTEDRIEAFCATLNVPSVSTYRSFLRRIARANASRRAIWNASPETFERKPSRLVYTDEQVAEYLRLVDVQATERRRFVLASVLNLCLGFGLRTRELFTLAPTDVRERDGLVLCHLPDRVIPARAEHAGAIVELAASVETRFFLADHQRPSEDMGGLLENVDIPRYLPRPSVRALRNTWVVSLMSAGNLTLREVYVVAGLTSGSAIDTLLPLLPVREGTYLHRAAGVDR